LIVKFREDFEEVEEETWNEDVADDEKDDVACECPLFEVEVKSGQRGLVLTDDFWVIKFVACRAGDGVDIRIVFLAVHAGMEGYRGMGNYVTGRGEI
jgi:hypothetical protein